MIATGKIRKIHHGISIQDCWNVQELIDTLEESPYTEIQRPTWITPGRMVWSDEECIAYLRKNLIRKGVYMLNRYRCGTHPDKYMVAELFVCKPDGNGNKVGYLVKFWNIPIVTQKINWTHRKNIVVMKFVNSRLDSYLGDSSTIESKITLISEI